MTLSDIRRELRRAGRRVQERQLYRYLKWADIRPAGRRTWHRQWPDDAAARLLAWLDGPPVYATAQEIAGAQLVSLAALRTAAGTHRTKRTEGRQP